MFGWSRPKSGKMQRAQRRKKKKREYQPLELWEAVNDEDDGRPTDTPADGSVTDPEEQGQADLIAPNRVLQADTNPLLPAEPTEVSTMNSFSATQPSRQTPQLRNTPKSALGNGLGGWNTAGSSGFGLGGGLGGGLGSGLGGARPAQLSGFAQVMGGGSGQGPIDMSDFPSLGGGPRPNASSASAAGWNANTIRQVSAQSQAQPQQLSQPPRAPSTAPSQRSLDQFDGQRASQPNNERTEDAFPPLSGQFNGDSSLSSNGLGSSVASPDSISQQQSGQQAQLPIRHPSNAYAHQPQQPAPIGSGGPASLPQQAPAAQNGPAQAPANVKRYADMTEAEQYGLPGMLAAFEARRAIEAGQPVDETLPPAMRSGVFLGQDLNTLGMDLDSPDPIYPTFTPFPVPPERGSGTMFDFHERNVVPEYTLPSAYTVTNVPPLERRITAFSDETLFSIFYQNPGDYKQELAAVELTARDWRWHKVLRQWLQKDTREASSGSSLPIVDLATTQPIGAPPVRVGERTERGVYVFFDAMNWQRQRREFSLDYGELDHRNAGGLAQAGMGMANGNGSGSGGGGGAAGPAPGLTSSGVLGAGGPVQPPAGAGAGVGVGSIGGNGGGGGGSIGSQGGQGQGAQRGAGAL
ncbi:transcriptional regulator [Recurvomyces mirabilis]|uniref:Transcriptional regulator n=1 Tax=Recurvomyces mirabilis TaxID=574656 RepID=A0AAE0TU54_9PEZI|nr:transcriptional regulator [Recurvomyces mirabilis]KAK5150737.1 transcriptional regulator [Recurvomyces mirabilis]